MHRARFCALSRALAATLAITVATSPALAAVHVVDVQADGTFLPKYLNIANGDTVEWRYLGLTDAVARLSTTGLQAGGLPLSASIDTTAACAVTAADDPAYVVTANAYRQPYEPTNPNELTGPNRRGVSGIWALGPEGGEVSKLEIPSPEADAIDSSVTAADPCSDLQAADLRIDNDPLDPTDDVVMKYAYVDAEIDSGEAPATPVPNPVLAGGAASHRLCNAHAAACDSAGTHCARVDPDPARPETIPPGTYLNGLLTSTYENPDVTGVVLRFNWKDLQYDDGTGIVTERWQHLDRELDRAIAHGKLVTFDVRAGMFGTPDWIFADWLRADPDDQDDAHAAPWCAAPGPCAYTPDAAPDGAGQVEDLSFVDHYDETPPGDGCGSEVRIGAPGDLHYRALYKAFIDRLATHVATDTRWWQAVAHVKASGANLRTSEAELPHHCNDDFVNTGDHQVAPKDNPVLGFGDRVLDVFKTELTDGAKVTRSCVCNTQVWFAAGYVPQDLYDYYAEVEGQILGSFFGEKSIGYQIIQDGFPRADATIGRSFLGDHLYREVLDTATTAPASPVLCGNGVVNELVGELCDDGADPVAFADQTDGCRSDCMPTYVTNVGVDAGAVCAAPSLVDLDGDGIGDKPEVDEDRTAATAEYCSADSLLDPLALDYELALTPVVADPADPTGVLAAFATDDDSGARYPTPFEQAVQVMAEAGDGRFANPTNPDHVDWTAGKLFVPQHSGLQAFPQEGVGLGYRASASAPCDQQLAPLAVPLAQVGRLGAFVASFPMPSTSHASPLTQDTTAGCPNAWIVDEGKDRASINVTSISPGQPPVTTVVALPPQLTGFQTTNKVRSIAHVESALFNLVYNTNAVFIELYEDSIWQIGRTRGTGAGADPLDGPVGGTPVRLATDPVSGAYLVCDPLVSCYSKNLYQWAEELHRRRITAAALWTSIGGLSFPGVMNPFPTTYRQTFVNTTGAPEHHAYINPSRCQPALIDIPNNGLPSALGAIRVRP